MITQKLSQGFVLALQQVEEQLEKVGELEQVLVSQKHQGSAKRHPHILVEKIFNIVKKKKALTFTFQSKKYLSGTIAQAQCNKTFYVRKLRMFIKGYSAFHAKPFQPSLMFVGKVMSLS